MLLKIGTQVRQSCGPVLRCGAGGQELLRLGLRPAAVVQPAAGAHQGGKVPIRRQPHFAIVQVEVPGGQGGGKPDSAMGCGSEGLKIDDALAIVDDFVAEKLGL